jgi:hypothetical protein
VQFRIRAVVGDATRSAGASALKVSGELATMQQHIQSPNNFEQPVHAEPFST